MKKIISLLFIALLIFNSSAYAADKMVFDFSEITPFNAAVRSALVPGWGQHWNGQKTKGYITFGVFAVSALAAYYFNVEADKYYDKYVDMGLVYGRYFDDYESNYKTSQILTFVAIGTWLFAVVDAYFVCKSKNKDTRTYSLNIYYDNNRDAAFVAYTKRFDI